MEQLLEELENKDIEVAGGSVVGIVLSTVNALIKYIANLTLGKKKYEDVQDKVKGILDRAEELKKKSLQAIDKDKEVVKEILAAYKTRKENEEKYQEVCRMATDFCMQVVYIANDTYELTEEISKVGNKMLASDFEICKFYAIASIQSAIENVNINVYSIKDDEYKSEIQLRCRKILENIKKKN